MDLWYWYLNNHNLTQVDTTLWYFWSHRFGFFRFYSLEIDCANIMQHFSFIHSYNIGFPHDYNKTHVNNWRKNGNVWRSFWADIEFAFVLFVWNTGIWEILFVETFYALHRPTFKHRCHVKYRECVVGVMSLIPADWLLSIFSMLILLNVLKC